MKIASKIEKIENLEINARRTVSDIANLIQRMDHKPVKSSNYKFVEILRRRTKSFNVQHIHFEYTVYAEVTLCIELI